MGTEVSIQSDPAVTATSTTTTQGVLYLYDKTKTSYPWKDNSLYVGDVEIEINEWYKEQ